jgi:phosphomannomutase
MSAFKAYDIRGIYNVDFNRNDVYKMGFFLPGLLGTSKILVGRDARISSPEIFEYLSKGINDAGADVYSIGLCTTPMLYYITAKHGFDGSVMITASHNPREYNGLKVSRSNALPVGYDTGLGDLEKKVVEETPVPIENKGKITDLNAKDEYLAFLKKYVPDLSELKISIDCSNGMACLLIKDLLGDQPNYLFDELDGTFPNHEANPLVPENVQYLIKDVKDHRADIGAIFDGDADRVMFVDEKGQFISPDLIIGVLAHYFLQDQKGNVLEDIRSSKAVGEYISKFGSTMHMWRVGPTFATPKMREIDGIFGGEFAGHYYFREFYYCNSGLLAFLICMDVFLRMKKQGITVSQLISQISAYANSGEVNYRIQQKSAAMEALKDFFSSREKPTAFYDFDGYRIEFPDWWFNIRPSNTEPYLRFLAEAKTEALLQEKIRQVDEILKEFV